MKKKPFQIFLDIFGFLTGSALNIGMTVVVIALAFTFTMKYFEIGKDFAETDNAVSLLYNEVEITIPEEADAMTIAGILEENGLIKNKYYFWIQARLNGSYRYFLSGTYKLSTNMSTSEIMETLKSLPVQDESVIVKVTIPEGYSIKQIAELLESKEFFTAQEFLDACGSTDYNFDFLEPVKDKKNYLEGYLFPDTYYLSENPTPDEIITKMLNRFDEIFDFSMREQASSLGLTIDEAVIIASIIEREIRVSDERELASSVIYNRLDDGMPLEMCSTVMYVLDKRKDRLLESDLQINSPYNTYNNMGLPIGPISNPGRDSLEAALNPASTNYLYFVLKDEETGEHHFTDSYSDFLRAKDEYNQRF